VSNSIPIRFCSRRFLSTSVESAKSAPIIAWSGARQFNIANDANSACFNSYIRKLDNYIENDSVGVVAFSADGGNFFAKSLDHDPTTMTTVNQFNNKLLSYPKHTMVYVEGNVSSSSFGSLSACKVSVDIVFELTLT
jgi:hypothetical protein